MPILRKKRLHSPKPLILNQRKEASLVFIFITLLIDVIGFGIIIPVMPPLIQELTGGTLGEAATYGGWLLFAYSIMQFACAPLLGALSDRYGRRPIILMSLFGFGLDYLFLAFAPNIAWLFIGRLIAGVTGASFTTASAYIADISSPEKRAQNFGLLGAAFGIGFTIAPAIGGILGDEYGVRAPFFAAAGFSLLNWLYGYFILPESLKEENRRSFEWYRANPFVSLFRLSRYPVILGLVSSLVFVYIAAHATQSTWTYYTMEKFSWGQKEVGLSLAFVGLMVAIVQGGLIRILVPRLGQKRSVYTGLVFYTIGLLFFGIADKGWMMFVFMIPYALGGIAGPAIQGIITNQVPADEQGELQGALTSMMSVCNIVGPLLMTNVFSYFSNGHESGNVYFPGAPFVLGSALTFISVALSVRSLRRFNV